MLTAAQSWVAGVIASATRRRAAADEARRLAVRPSATNDELRRELVRLAYMMDSCAHLDEAVVSVFGESD